MPRRPPWPPTEDVPCWQQLTLKTQTNVYLRASFGAVGRRAKDTRGKPLDVFCGNGPLFRKSEGIQVEDLNQTFAYQPRGGGGGSLWGCLRTRQPTHPPKLTHPPTHPDPPLPPPGGGGGAPVL